MFDSLFNVKINWPVYLVSCFLVLLIPGLSIASYFVIFVSIYQFYLLYFSLNHALPIRYLFGFLMCIQMFIGPVLVYNGLEQYQYESYKMQIPEAEYFSYAIPAVLAFIIGLNLNAGRLQGEVLNIKGLIEFVKPLKRLPYVFIVIGFLPVLFQISYHQNWRF